MNFNIKACGNSDESHECNGICEQAQLYGIENVCKKIKTTHLSDEPIFFHHGIKKLAKIICNTK